MSGLTWTKFYWADWETDPALRLCSLAAQGLWMRMLCVAASHDPTGYVCIAGQGLGVTDLARLTGASETEVAALLAELSRYGVFSRDAKGRIYSRRMVRDARRHATAVKNGKNGGNPNLGNNRGNPASVNPHLKPRDKPHKPRARKKVEPINGSNLLSARPPTSEPEGSSPSRRKLTIEETKALLHGENIVPLVREAGA